MLLVYGIILLVVSVIAFFISNLIIEMGFQLILKKLSIGVACVGLIMFTFSSSFWAKPGHQYFIVSPLGSLSTVFTEGFKFAPPFSKVQEWESYIDIKVVSKGEPREGIDGVIEDSIAIRFIDKVKGNVKVSVRMKMPIEEESFISLAKEFRNPKNLVNNTLIPTVKEQVINTGYMFTAENYVSGDASNFRSTLDEQLKGGGYAVDKIEIHDTIIAPITEGKAREIKEITTRRLVVKRLDENGYPVRVIHDIAKNKIEVSQVIVDQVTLEGNFQKKLEDARDLSAARSIEIQKIGLAKVEQQRIIAVGERDKAGERVTQEKVQVKALIAIETRLKTEQTKKKLAKIALETTEFLAKAVIVDANAKAHAKKKLMQADGALEQKLEAWVQAQRFWAKSQKGVRQTPNINSGGGNQSTAQDYIQIMGMKAAKDLSLDMKIK